MLVLNLQFFGGRGGSAYEMRVIQEPLKKRLFISILGLTQILIKHLTLTSGTVYDVP